MIDARVKPPNKTLRRVGVFVGLGLVILIGLSIPGACELDERMYARSDAFLAALRSASVEGAYRQLSEQRRATMPLAEFSALTDHPAFRKNTAADLSPRKTTSDGRCLLGGVTVGPAEWRLQLYLVEEGDDYRVQSFALQPPTRLPLGMLVEECGYGAGTVAGYSGPPRERATRELE